MFEHLNRNKLFVGRVISINPEEYTLTVLPANGRMGLRKVRMLVPNSGNVRNKFRGFSWLPYIGDWAVCAFLEGYPDYPICLGVIYNISNTRPPEASANDGEYQYYDYVVQQQTGSYIRIRNLNQPTFINGNWIDPVEDLPEITIYQMLADKTKANKIVMKEESSGSSTVEIEHHTGAKVTIDATGNIILTPATGKQVDIGSSSASQSLVLGDNFKALFNAHVHATAVGPSGPALDSTFVANPMGTAGTTGYPHLSVKAKTEL